MRRKALILAVLCCFVTQIAEAQFKGLGNVINKADAGAKKAQATVQEYVIDEQDEIAIGEQISAKVRAKYGVAQDPAIHKYVGLVGMVLAKKSTRPNLPWQFFVLDTDGVNAFAAPGGYIHITRGALALMTSEAELAGVLGHEIAHVTRKHTVKSLEADKGIGAGLDKSGTKKRLTDTPQVFQRIVDKGFDLVFDGYGRDQELDSDAVGPPLAAKAGYLPIGLSLFLRTLEMRNSGSEQKQGLFASHPEMKERIEKLDETTAKDTSGATAMLLDRYTLNVKYKPVPLVALAVTDAPAAAAAPPAEEKKEEKKPSRFSLGSLKNPLAGGSESKQSATVTGSGGSRGVDRERLAKGGSNPNKVAVTITDADIAAFIKDGKLTS